MSQIVFRELVYLPAELPTLERALSDHHRYHDTIGLLVALCSNTPLLGRLLMWACTDHCNWAAENPQLLAARPASC
jgi:hypothetical protein